LFAAVMTQAVEVQAQRVFATMAQDDEDVEAALRRFGRAYVELMLQPDFLAFREGRAGGRNQQRAGSDDL
jgi:hypothetical protein